MSGVVALIPAAGTGARLGGHAKVALSLGGRDLLHHCLEALEKSGAVSHVVVALPPGMSQRPATQATLSVTFVPGGERRQASVRRALAAAPASELVVIHDVARPLASPDLFRRVIDAARGDGAATAAVPARDTVRLVPNGDGGRTLQRTQVRLVQTPQAFRREILERAHETAAAEGWQADDDAELVERLGLPVALVEGEERNLKITTRADLLVAEVLLSEDGRSMRVL